MKARLVVIIDVGTTGPKEAFGEVDITRVIEEANKERKSLMLSNDADGALDMALRVLKIEGL